MIKTNNFINIPLEIQQSLGNKNINLSTLLNDNMFNKLETAENRSIIFEINNSNLIVKFFKDKGKRDFDIEALLDLDGIKYFPTIFAYEKHEYVIMERALGKRLDEVLINRPDENVILMIKERFKEATELALQKNRYDWDFKLEHLYWDENSQELKLIDLGLFDMVPENKEWKEGLLNSRVESLNNKIDEFKLIYK